MVESTQVVDCAEAKMPLVRARDIRTSVRGLR